MAQRPDIKGLLPRLKAARRAWSPPPPSGVKPEIPGANQESVWDYPRPPKVLPAEAPISAYLGSTLVMRSSRALRIVETAGAPVYYAHPEDWVPSVLRHAGRYTVCEWKGVATTLDVVTDGGSAPGGAFVYEDPLRDLGQGYEAIANWPAPHPAHLRCFLGDELAYPQPGGLYAGWVTSRIAGPVKGAPGTGHW